MINIPNQFNNGQYQEEVKKFLTQYSRLSEYLFKGYNFKRQTRFGIVFSGSYLFNACSINDILIGDNKKVLSLLAMKIAVKMSNFSTKRRRTEGKQQN